MRYRCKVELAAEVLVTAIEKVVKKTHIMNNGKLNSKQMKNYLNMLLDSELLSFDSVNGGYITSAKGKDFLELYAQYEHQQCEAEKLNAAAIEKKVRLEQMCRSGRV